MSTAAAVYVPIRLCDPVFPCAAERIAAGRVGSATYVALVACYHCPAVLHVYSAHRLTVQRVRDDSARRGWWHTRDGDSFARALCGGCARRAGVAARRPGPGGSRS